MIVKVTTKIVEMNGENAGRILYHGDQIMQTITEDYDGLVVETLRLEWRHLSSIKEKLEKESDKEDL